jgi:cell division protein ZapA
MRQKETAMARIDIEVNGRPYSMACQDGQEVRLKDLAGYVDGRLKDLTGGGRAGSEAQMLVMTCLVLADELHDLMAGRGLAVPPRTGAADAAGLVDAVNAVARRLEEVAARLERS